MTTAAKAPSKSRSKTTPNRNAAVLAGSLVSTSVGSSVLRLSDPTLKPDMDRLKAKLRDDPAFALKTLRSAGIATAAGKLTKRFKD